MEEQFDRQRQPLDLALSCARTMQNGQTGFIHYCYKTYDEEPPVTIPTSENLLFALALLRTRMADSVAEAKELINRILNFQNLSNDNSRGNFPVYLHDYPQCRDSFLGAHLLPTFFWILRDYRRVLGAELTPRLQTAVELLVHQLLEQLRQGPVSYALTMKIAASAVGLGKLLEKSDWVLEGENLLKILHGQGVTASWFSPNQLGDMLIALHMLYPNLSQSPWKNLWDYLHDTWHQSSCAYAGPALELRQRQSEPQSTIYDIFMGHFSGSYSYRSFQLHPFQLQAALIHPTEDRFEKMQYPFIKEGEWEGRAWRVYQTESYAYAIIPYHEKENPSQEYRVHPLKVIWGDQTITHTFVHQGGTSEKMDYLVDENGELKIDFLLPSAPEGMKESLHEISFYIDMHEGLEKSVNEKKATTFELGDEVRLHSDGINLILNFEREDESNRFLGHLMPGNRPSQMYLKGASRFKAFDYQIYLRAIERTSACHAIVRLRIEKGVSVWK